VTGAGGLNQTLSVSYTNNVNAGTATASASYATTDNYLAGNGSTTFTIERANVASLSFVDASLVKAHVSSTTRLAPSVTMAPTAVQVTLKFFQNGQEVGTSGLASAPAASYGVTGVGVYNVEATVTDQNYVTQTVKALFVIYDANGSFVTGGGWINSPEGACKLTATCTGAVGKANFGFVSKYQPGAKVPSGNTEFQFHAGNLNFKSTVYEWLTVAGARAQYKGDGTINGQPGFKFILTAVDGGLLGGSNPDQFRIKILRVLDGLIVYDNMVSTDQTLDGDLNAPIAGNGTLLGGGSIQIKTR
jgi:hypothetical protein